MHSSEKAAMALQVGITQEPSDICKSTQENMTRSLYRLALDWSLSSCSSLTTHTHTHYRIGLVCVHSWEINICGRWISLNWTPVGHALYKPPHSSNLYIFLWVFTYTIPRCLYRPPTTMIRCKQTFNTRGKRIIYQGYVCTTHVTYGALTDALLVWLASMSPLTLWADWMWGGLRERATCACMETHRGVNDRHCCHAVHSRSG